jgi:hypothetical protein
VTLDEGLWSREGERETYWEGRKIEYRDMSLEVIRGRERAHRIKCGVEERDSGKMGQGWERGGEREIEWELMREKEIGWD